MFHCQRHHLGSSEFRAGRPDAAADLFYSRLFSVRPELRELFPSDLRDQKRKLNADDRNGGRRVEQSR